MNAGQAKKELEFYIALQFDNAYTSIMNRLMHLDYTYHDYCELCDEESKIEICDSLCNEVFNEIIEELELSGKMDALFDLNHSPDYYNEQLIVTEFTELLNSNKYKSKLEKIFRSKFFIIKPEFAAELIIIQLHSTIANIVDNVCNEKERLQKELDKETRKYHDELSIGPGLTYTLPAMDMTDPFREIRPHVHSIKKRTDEDYYYDYDPFDTSHLYPVNECGTIEAEVKREYYKTHATGIPKKKPDIETTEVKDLNSDSAKIERLEKSLEQSLTLIRSLENKVKQLESKYITDKVNDDLNSYIYEKAIEDFDNLYSKWGEEVLYLEKDSLNSIIKDSFDKFIKDLKEAEGISIDISNEDIVNGIRETYKESFLFKISEKKGDLK
jgi:hypothetical protein